MTILPPGKNPVSPPVRSAWIMVEETLVRLRGIILPRIEWFRIRFRLRRVERQKEQALVRLGRAVADPGRDHIWPHDALSDPELSGVIQRIRDLERHEVQLREWLEYLEDRETSGILAHLNEDLARRILRTQTILVTDDSPYFGRSIGDLRKNSPSEGVLPLTALRGNAQVEIGPGLPLGAGDRLVLLSVWKKLREIPPSTVLFEVDGGPDRQEIVGD